MCRTPQLTTMLAIELRSLTSEHPFQRADRHYVPPPILPRHFFAYHVGVCLADRVSTQIHFTETQTSTHFKYFCVYRVGVCLANIVSIQIHTTDTQTSTHFRHFCVYHVGVCLADIEHPDTFYRYSNIHPFQTLLCIPCWGLSCTCRHSEHPDTFYRYLNINLFQTHP